MSDQLSRRAILRRGAQIGIGTAVVTGRATAARTISDWRVEIQKRDNEFDECRYNLTAEGASGYDVTVIEGQGDESVTIEERTFDRDRITATGSVSTSFESDVWEFRHTTKPLPELTTECDVTITEL